jgi:uncharacterized phage-associated protein
MTTHRPKIANFPFEVAKAVQSFGVLFSSENDPKVAFYRLLKLLYISDREFLKETGRPIVGGTDVAMKKGPLNSQTYDLIKGEHPDSNVFLKHFTKDGKRLLVMRTDPGRDDLSRREVRKLMEVSERYRDLDDDELGDLTHEFLEYSQNYVEDTSRPISLQSKLEALDMTKSKESIEADIEAIVAWKHLIGSVS